MHHDQHHTKNRLKYQNMTRSLTPLMALSLGGIIAASMLIGPAFAVKTVNDFKEPFSVQLKTTLDSKTTKKGDVFEGVLNEDYQYENSVLPAGTVFKGVVDEVRSSKYFSRPGYLVLNVQEVVLPSGEVHQLSLVKGVGAQSQKLTGQESKTFMKNLKNNFPLTVASLGTSLPLNFATNISPAIVAPIAMGARMAAGVVVETTGGGSSKSVQDKVLSGVWRGTGLPGAYGFVAKDKDVHFDVGAQVPLQLDPDAVKGLFMIKSIVRDSANPVQPKAVPFTSGEVQETEYSNVSPVQQPTPVREIAPEQEP